MNIFTETNIPNIIHYTSADFKKREILKPIHIVQYDDSLPILAVKLFVGGEPYYIPDIAEINIRFCRKDRSFVYNPALGCNEARNTVYFEVTRKMTEVNGSFYPVIELKIDDKISSTSPISLEIDRNPIQTGYVESSSEFKTLEEHIQDFISDSLENAKNSGEFKPKITAEHINGRTNIYVDGVFVTSIIDGRVDVNSAEIRNGHLYVILSNDDEIDCGEVSGPKGDPGIAPHINENGNWSIGDEDTGVKAQGENGSPGINADMFLSCNTIPDLEGYIEEAISKTLYLLWGGVDTDYGYAKGTPDVQDITLRQGGLYNITLNPNNVIIYISEICNLKGANGITPHIGANGNWYLGDEDTGLPSRGLTGDNGQDGQDGRDGIDGAPGTPGDKGDPGEKGADGITPHIGENGNWYIGDEDTGLPSRGENGTGTELLRNLSKETLESENLQYWLYTPDDTAGSKPLIVYLHSAYSNGDDLDILLNKEDFLKWLNCGWLGTINAYIVIPQIVGGEWKNHSAAVKALVDDIKTTKSINSGRILITGFSKGATGALDIAATYPDVFSRVVTVAGEAGNAEEIERKARIFASRNATPDMSAESYTGNYTYIKSFVSSTDRTNGAGSITALVNRMKELHPSTESDYLTVVNRDGMLHDTIPRVYVDNRATIFDFLVKRNNWTDGNYDGSLAEDTYVTAGSFDADNRLTLLRSDGSSVDCGIALSNGGVDLASIEAYIDQKLGAIENGTY